MVSKIDGLRPSDKCDNKLILNDSWYVCVPDDIIEGLLASIKKAGYQWADCVNTNALKTLKEENKASRKASRDNLKGNYDYIATYSFVAVYGKPETSEYYCTPWKSNDNSDGLSKSIDKRELRAWATLLDELRQHNIEIPMAEGLWGYTLTCPEQASWLVAGVKAELEKIGSGYTEYNRHRKAYANALKAAKKNES